MNDFSDGLRCLLAIFLFCLGGYLIFDLIAFGFSIYVLLGAIVCFYGAHYVRPRNSRREEQTQDGLDPYDLVCIITSFPYYFVATILRGAGRIFSGSSTQGGFDIGD